MSQEGPDSIRTSGSIPRNMITITDAVRDKLTAVDPGHGADYARTAAALKAELTDLTVLRRGAEILRARGTSSPPTPPSATWPVATT